MGQGATQATPTPEKTSKLGMEEGMIYSLEKLEEDIDLVKRGWRPNPRSHREKVLDRMVDRCHRLVETIKTLKESREKESAEVTSRDAEAKRSKARKEMMEVAEVSGIYAFGPGTWRELAIEQKEEKK